MLRHSTCNPASLVASDGGLVNLHSALRGRKDSGLDNDVTAACPAAAPAAVILHSSVSLWLGWIALAISNQGCWRHSLGHLPMVRHVQSVSKDLIVFGCFWAMRLETLDHRIYGSYEKEVKIRSKCRGGMDRFRPSWQSELCKVRRTAMWRIMCGKLSGTIRSWVV